jgi:predicted membrane protein
MSLRMFHMVFIAFTVMLAAFVAAWAGQQYTSAHSAGYAVTAALSILAGGALIVYGTAFQRKTKGLTG